MVLVDGPSGSGKSTIAAAVVAALPDAHLLHLDDLLDGWDGLDEAPDVLDRQVMRHLGAERGLQHRRYDWERAHFVTPAAVPVTAVLVVEGVGAGARTLARHADLLVWVEASREVRRSRALSRDGETFAPWIDAWNQTEDAHHRRERTQQRADLVLHT